MANFQTHFYVATTLTGGTAAGLLAMGQANEQQAAHWLLLGVAGGLLPDIDADNSRPVRIAFTILGIVLAFQAILLWANQFTAWELGMFWIAIFLGVRFALFEVFTRFTRHRGMIHSVPMGVAIALAIVLFSYEVAQQSAEAAWLNGGFLLYGFLIHLLLDEFYAIDITGAQLKRSFGTAFKFGSLKSPLLTAALYSLIGTLLWYAPPLAGLPLRLQELHLPW